MNRYFRVSFMTDVGQSLWGAEILSILTDLHVLGVKDLNALDLFVQ